MQLSEYLSVCDWFCASIQRIKLSIQEYDTTAVTDDTCKSELLAASTCVEEFVWARKLISELKLNQLSGDQRMDKQRTLTICSSVGNYDGAIRYATQRKETQIAENGRMRGVHDQVCSD